jgi:hypothetical protein
MKILIFGMIGFLVPLWIEYAIITFYKLDLSFESSYGFPLSMTFEFILFVGIISGVKFGSISGNTKIITHTKIK